MLQVCIAHLGVAPSCLLGVPVTSAVSCGGRRQVAGKEAMFVRVTWTRGIGYLRIVESYRKDGVSRHRVILSSGRCDDQATVETVRELVREYRPLERAPVVIAEVEEASGRAQGKGCFRKLRGWK